MSETPSKVVRHLSIRFAALSGYAFGNGKHFPRGWVGSSKQRDDARRQYVNDMRWVRELFRALDA